MKKYPSTPAIDAWVAYMRFTGQADTTILTRSRVLRRVNGQAGDLLALTKVDLIGWLSAYATPSTRATVLSYLRAFYQWAHLEELIDTNPTARIPTVKVPSAKPRPADRADIALALAQADEQVRAMMLLMAYAGLRCCEVAGFRPEHVEQRGDNWWVYIPRSKGGHVQAVPIPDHVAAELRGVEPWAISSQWVQKKVRAALKGVGSDATPHMLRHYYGTTALQSTSNLRQVQEMMRHSSPTTTARYTAVAGEELSHAANLLPRIA